MSLGRLFFLFLVAILLVIGIKHYLSTPASSPVPLKNGPILAFGDSLTYGYGASSEESYPMQLQKRLGREVINGGVPGELSEEGLKRLGGLLKKHRPSLLILCHGGNDILRQKEQEQLRSNLKEMIVSAKSENIEVVLIAVPEFGILQLTPPPLYRELAQEFSLPFEEEILPRVLHDNRTKSDLIHPNALGYAAMADALEKVLKEHYQLSEGKNSPP
jgi:acyl-CoA thioesterase I